MPGERPKSIELKTDRTEAVAKHGVANKIHALFISCSVFNAHDTNEILWKSVRLRSLRCWRFPARWVGARAYTRSTYKND